MKIRWRMLAIASLVILTLIGVFPIAIKIAEPCFTRPFDSRFLKPVLLVWPDRVEIRVVNTISEVSPVPKGEGYTFVVPMERLLLVQEEVKKLPNPGSDSAWLLRVKQVSRDQQIVDLESFGDGFEGMIYEAHPTRILPMHTRIADPGAAFTYLEVDVGINCIVWSFVWLVAWLARLRAQRRALTVS